MNLKQFLRQFWIQVTVLTILLIVACFFQHEAVLMRPIPCSCSTSCTAYRGVFERQFNIYTKRGDFMVSSDCVPYVTNGRVRRYFGIYVVPRDAGRLEVDGTSAKLDRWDVKLRVTSNKILLHTDEDGIISVPR